MAGQNWAVAGQKLAVAQRLAVAAAGPGPCAGRSCSGPRAAPLRPGPGSRTGGRGPCHGHPRGWDGGARSPPPPGLPPGAGRWDGIAPPAPRATQSRRPAGPPAVDGGCIAGPAARAPAGPPPLAGPPAAATVGNGGPTGGRPASARPATGPPGAHGAATAAAVAPDSWPVPGLVPAAPAPAR